MKIAVLHLSDVHFGNGNNPILTRAPKIVPRGLVDATGLHAEVATERNASRRDRVFPT